MMDRRAFTTLLGSAAAWPLAARAQQRTIPVIGWLNGAGSATKYNFDAFRRGLNERGYTQDTNVRIEFTSAQGRYDRLPALAADLARRQPSVIFIDGSTPASLAAKAATSTIPIVFAIGSDAVALRLVDSMNRPGGNVTGVNFLSRTLLPKRLELLHELVPRATTIAFLANPTNSATEQNTQDLQAADRSIGKQIVVIPASTAIEIDAAFATMAREHLDALVVGQDTFCTTSIIKSSLLRRVMRSRQSTLLVRSSWRAAS
jgi:putative ABC transport system substrate-binding protein